MFLLTSLGSPEQISLSRILYRGEVSDGDIAYNTDFYHYANSNMFYWKSCSR